MTSAKSFVFLPFFRWTKTYFDFFRFNMQFSKCSLPSTPLQRFSLSFLRTDAILTDNSFSVNHHFLAVNLTLLTSRRLSYQIIFTLSTANLRQF